MLYVRCLSMSRPLKEINWEVVEKLIECGCSGVEIAAKFRIKSDTFYIRFKKQYDCSFQDYRVEAKEAGLADLRAMIHAKALNNKAPGNSNLLIFLAKCQLGMREPDVVQTIAPNQEKIDQTHRIMMLEHALAEAKERQ